jgi:hypothetical protein
MKCRVTDENYPLASRSADALHKLQLIVSIALCGNRAGAVAGAGALVDKVVAEEARRALAQINANLQRRDEARADIENAVRRQPLSRVLRPCRAPLAGLAAWPGSPANRPYCGFAWPRHETCPREPHLRLVAAELLRDAGAARRALTLLGRGLELAPGTSPF